MYRNFNKLKVLLNFVNVYNIYSIVICHIVIFDVDNRNRQLKLKVECLFFCFGRIL